MYAVRIAFVVGSLGLGLALFTRLHHAGASIFFLSYGGIGGYLAVRRPANSIGWLLLLIGWGLELGSVQILVPPPGEPLVTDFVAAIAVWGSGCGWSLAFLGVLCISLVFPEGRLSPGTSGRLSRLAIGVMVVLVLAVCLNPVSNIIPVGGSLNTFVPNPLALAPDAAFWQFVPAIDTLHYGMLVLVVLGLGAMLVRARSATGMVRVQYRWLLAALLLIVLSTASWAIATLGFGAEAFGAAFLPVLVAYSAVPAAIAVAVLRYRLYDIDRIISRTIGWTLVSGLLVAAFAILVVGLQAVLSGVTQGETLAVAASTLVAFALFQPVRRTVQRAVDRRFDRARYDAQRTADAFAERLRDEVDLETLAAELERTVAGTVRPTAASIWLPGRQL